MDVPQILTWPERRGAGGTAALASLAGLAIHDRRAGDEAFRDALPLIVAAGAEPGAH